MEYKITEKWTKERLNEIQRIKTEEGLNVDNILRNAKQKDNPLHGMYDWNTTKSAEMWWRHQTRIFLNEIKLIIDDKEMYAFENVWLDVVDEDSDHQRIYEDRITIMENKGMRQQMIEQAYGHLCYWQTKYDGFKELKPVYAAIKKIESKLKK